VTESSAGRAASGGRGRRAAGGRDRRGRPVEPEGVGEQAVAAGLGRCESGLALGAEAEQEVLEPEQPARGDGRRLGVAGGAGEHDDARAGRLLEVVRREADPGLGARQAERAAHGAAEPGIGARQPRPGALVEAAEDHQVGRLHARLERAPDRDAWVGDRRGLGDVARGDQRLEERAVLGGVERRGGVGLGGERVEERAGLLTGVFVPEDVRGRRGWPGRERLGDGAVPGDMLGERPDARGQWREGGLDPGDPGGCVLAGFGGPGADGRPGDERRAAAQVLALEPGGEAQVRATGAGGAVDQRLLQED
jgi:hypothetical protein